MVFVFVTVCGCVPGGLEALASFFVKGVFSRGHENIVLFGA